MDVKTIPPIEEMTVSQKVELMEQLWESMGRKNEDLEPRKWHGEVLEVRRQAVARGELDYVDWEEAKKGLRSRLT